MREKVYVTRRSQTQSSNTHDTCWRDFQADREPPTRRKSKWIRAHLKCLKYNSTCLETCWQTSWGQKQLVCCQARGACLCNSQSKGISTAWSTRTQVHVKTGCFLFNCFLNIYIQTNQNKYSDCLLQKKTLNEAAEWAALHRSFFRYTKYCEPLRWSFLSIIVLSTSIFDFLNVTSDNITSIPSLHKLKYSNIMTYKLKKMCVSVSSFP